MAARHHVSDRRAAASSGRFCCCAVIRCTHCRLLLATHLRRTQISARASAAQYSAIAEEETAPANVCMRHIDSVAHFRCASTLTDVSIRSARPGSWWLVLQLHFSRPLPSWRDITAKCSCACLGRVAMKSDGAPFTGAHRKHSTSSTLTLRADVQPFQMHHESCRPVFHCSPFAARWGAPSSPRHGAHFRDLILASPPKQMHLMCCRCSDSVTVPLPTLSCSTARVVPPPISLLLSALWFDKPEPRTLSLALLTATRRTVLLVVVVLSLYRCVAHSRSIGSRLSTDSTGRMQHREKGINSCSPNAGRRCIYWRVSLSLSLGAQPIPVVMRIAL